MQRLGDARQDPALSGPGRWRPEGGGLMLLCWACTCENSQEGSGWGRGRGRSAGTLSSRHLSPAACLTPFALLFPLFFGGEGVH